MCLLQQFLVAMVEGTAFPVRAFRVLVLADIRGSHDGLVRGAGERLTALVRSSLWLEPTALVLMYLPTEEVSTLTRRGTPSRSTTYFLMSAFTCVVEVQWQALQNRAVLTSAIRKLAS